ncbi:MAG: LysE family transporter [Flavobacteriales bacterium]|nr:LysE family transporter [Flavobacteriales bacterium]MCB9447583.1 LysE family transporter [Flavobacteriales bacterium]
MIEAAIKGIGLGLVLSVMVGPVFFALIETSIKKGLLSALFFDLGIISCDAFLMFVAYKSTTSFDISPEALTYMKYIGGIVLILMGGFKMFRRTAISEETKTIAVETEHFYQSYLKGFFLNILNPAVLLYWTGVVVFAIGTYKGRKDTSVFFLSILATLFSTDMTKAYLAKFLRGILTPLLIERISRIVGGVFVIFGVALLLR